MRLLLVVVMAMVPMVVRGQLRELTPENWDESVPAGKEVDAIYGDVGLANDHARAIVAAVTAGRNANMTVRNISGCLIDLATRAHESDQLSAFYPGRRRYPLRSIAAGANGSVVVSAEGSESRPAYVTQYRMEPGRPVINVTSTWTNTTNSEITLRLEDDLRMDGGQEDMVRSVGGVEPMFWIHDLHWQQAYGVFAPGFEVMINGNDRETVLRYQTETREPIRLPAGESWEFTRKIIVARDLPEVRAVHDELTESASLHPVAVALKDSSGNPIAGARLTFSSGADIRGTSVTDDQGVALLRLPARDWKLALSSAGVVLPESEETRLTVEPGENHFDVQSEINVGTVSAEITDEADRPIPAKVEFIGGDPKLTPDWGPDTGEHFVGNLAYTEDGTFDVALVAGAYDVIVSHGPEYDAVFTTLEIMKGESAPLRVQLRRSVHTPGWISADFHSHSTPSGDNTGSQLGRVLNLAAEHIEFAPCTEHNRVSTYDNHIQKLGLQAQLATVTGMELTGKPLRLNHQNVFPMIHRPRTQDGGGPQNDRSPETQVERLAAWDNGSEKLIQQNHPDIGWLFFDSDGDGKPDNGHERSFPVIDVMEVHPIDRILKLQQFDYHEGEAIGNHRLLNWLQLLNQGFRIYGVVNTDAHYNRHGSGGLRNWIQSSTDDPAKIDANEMMNASEQGRLVMSNGPYLEAVFSEKGSRETWVSGQDLTATSGDVVIDVRVQCANWLDVDTVFVLVNGRVSEQHMFRRETHPELFGDGSQKFHHTLTLHLKEDSHLVVATGHSTRQLGGVLGPRWGSQKPAAVTNPVFVDVDGDGFEPNQDTLGYPLPMKFEKTAR